MRELKFRAWDGKKMIDDVIPASETSIIELFEHEWQETEVKAVEQYTGLKDKNGKEIYEGDIVNFRERAYEVKFDNYGQFHIENKNYHWLENGYSFRSVDIWCADGILVEVIGNIHEHKELLEENDVG